MWNKLFLSMRRTRDVYLPLYTTVTVHDSSGMTVQERTAWIRLKYSLPRGVNDFNLPAMRNQREHLNPRCIVVLLHVRAFDTWILHPPLSFFVPSPPFPPRCPFPSRYPFVLRCSSGRTRGGQVCQACRQKKINGEEMWKDKKNGWTLKQGGREKKEGERKKERDGREGWKGLARKKEWEMERRARGAADATCSVKEEERKVGRIRRRIERRARRGKRDESGDEGE